MFSPNVDVHAIVYAYCERKGAVPSSDEYPYYDPSRHGRPVYVGQTMQTLAERDAQHIRSKDTPFDRQYGDRSQYVLVRLDERTFPRARHLTATLSSTHCAWRRSGWT